MTDVLLEIKGLIKTFKQRKETVHAVDNVSFKVDSGETFGLVGESGCGKSTLARAILKLISIDSGEILFDGVKLHELSGSLLREQRLQMRMIFQKPFASLNPRQVIRDIIAAPFDVHKSYMSRAEREKEVLRLMDVVGIASMYADRYPHEFSGGQRQRVGIARAIALNPKLIVCDEPVSALDVSIQAQILNLLKELQKKFCLTYIFISHNLSVVRHMSNRVAVMYLGSFVEMASAADLYEEAFHPYTKALLSAIPNLSDKGKRERMILSGDIPSPLRPPRGCRFCTRCPEVMPRCLEERPTMLEINENHKVACFLYEGRDKM